MAEISLTRLSGGNTPADGSDPRTFPAIWNASATAIEDAIATIPEGGASVTVSETAPVSPAEGDLWLNSTEAKMYVYYDDGTSAQWVAAVGGTVPQQGKILQVVSTEKTDTFSASLASAAQADVTGLAVSITPSDASSKVLVLFDVHGASNSNSSQVIIKRGSTSIGVGASTGSRTPVTAAGPLSGESLGIGGGPLFSGVGTVLDSPATTSSVTYKVTLMNHRDQTATSFVNRGSVDTDSARFGRSASRITVMEVAG